MSQDVLEKMDEEVRRATIALARVKERRNDVIPIFRLPAEILAQILYLHVSGHFQDYSSPVARILASLVIVSRRIRTLVLGSRKLWRCIDFRSLPSVKKMLSMAEDIPLSLRADIEPFDDPPLHISIDGRDSGGIWDTILGDVRRLRELHIRASQPNLGKLYAIMDRSKPTTIPLVSLRIDCTEGKLASISECLTNCTAPQLSHLDIRDGKLPLACPLLGTALRHLELRVSSGLYPKWSPGSLHSVLERLRAFPNLHTLILHNCLPASSPVELESVGRVHLPCLKNVELADDIVDCVGLLNQMENAYLARVSLICTPNWSHEVSSRSFLGSISHVGQRDWIRTLSLVGSPTGRLTSLVAWPIDRVSICTSERRKLPCYLGTPSLSVQFLLHNYGCSGLADTECAGMRLDGVRMLVFYACAAWPATAWRHAFQQCSELTHLAISDVDLDILAEVLSAGDELMMRKLQFVDLVRVRLDGKTKTLHDLLQYRRDHNSAVRHLRLYDCSGFTRHDIDLWCQVVAQVQCQITPTSF